MLLEVWSQQEAPSPKAVLPSLEVLPPLEALPLLEVVPLGETQAGTTSRLRPATIPSHSHRFPLQLNFGPQSNSEPSTCEEFRHMN